MWIQNSNFKIDRINKKKEADTLSQSSDSLYIDTKSKYKNFCLKAIRSLTVLIKELIYSHQIIKMQQFQKPEESNFDFDFKRGGSIRKGQFCMLNQQPCKVMDLDVSKPGKHGSAKVLISGTNIFTGKKIQQIYSTSDSIMVPIVKKIELQALGIDDDSFVTLLLPNGQLREDIKLPDCKQQRTKLRKAFDANQDQCSIYFTVISACSQSRIVDMRISKN